VSERQVDQETVAIVQPAEDECRNKGIENERKTGSSPVAILSLVLIGRPELQYRNVEDFLLLVSRAVLLRMYAACGQLV